MQKNTYLQWSANIDKEFYDLFCAVLAEANFDTFEETETGINAYIKEEEYNEDLTMEFLSLYFPDNIPNYTTQIIEDENWNENWEKNYPNLYIEDFCQVLPSFRQPLEGFTYTLFIEPKMSFGTGHHSTTQLVMTQLKKITIQDKMLLDMGCGTGILGILASKMGAKEIIGIDIDAWCAENSLENIALNHIKNMDFILGGAEVIPNQAFDIILANINLHVLLADGQYYVPKLAKEGVLILSGFYENDIPTLVTHFEKLGLTYNDKNVLNDWATLQFIKN